MSQIWERRTMSKYLSSWEFMQSLELNKFPLMLSSMFPIIWGVHIKSEWTGWLLGIGRTPHQAMMLPFRSNKIRRSRWIVTWWVYKALWNPWMKGAPGLFITWRAIEGYYRAGFVFLIYLKCFFFCQQVKWGKQMGFEQNPINSAIITSWLAPSCYSQRVAQRIWKIKALVFFFSQPWISIISLW